MVAPRAPRALSRATCVARITCSAARARVRSPPKKTPPRPPAISLPLCFEPPCANSHPHHHQTNRLLPLAPSHRRTPPPRSPRLLLWPVLSRGGKGAGRRFAAKGGARGSEGRRKTKEGSGVGRGSGREHAAHPSTGGISRRSGRAPLFPPSLSVLPPSCLTALSLLAPAHQAARAAAAAAAPLGGPGARRRRKGDLMFRVFSLFFVLPARARIQCVCVRREKREREVEGLAEATRVAATGGRRWSSIARALTAFASRLVPILSFRRPRCQPRHHTRARLSFSGLTERAIASCHY
jgi:hypothetical protein